MSDTTERGLCPECRTEQQVNKDGTIRKHGTCEPGQFPMQPDEPPADDSTPPAEEIPDSGHEPAVERVPDPAPQGDSGDEPDSTEGVHGPNEGETTAPEGDPEQTPVEDLDTDGTYPWQITVAQPAIYLDDPAWHAANSALAAQHATDAGHTPAGEAQCTAVAATEDGTGLTLTYLLPIDTES